MYLFNTFLQILKNCPVVRGTGETQWCILHRTQVNTYNCIIYFYNVPDQGGYGHQG